MLDTLHVVLFLHVAGAIIAFGPTYAFMIGGSFSRREPMHGNFMLRVNAAISDRQVIPFALSLAVTGIALVWLSGRRFEEPWLAVSIVIYVVAIGVSLFVQRPAIHRMIELTSTPPGPGGPPAEFGRLARRTARVGMLLSIASLAIVLLMVTKPGA